MTKKKQMPISPGRPAGTWDKKPSRETLEQVLLDSYGNQTVAMKRLGVNRKTLRKWIQHEKLEDVVLEGQEGLLDLAENKLASKINDGDTTALLFFLKTKGKHRGYVERQEHQVHAKIEQIKTIKVIGR